MVTELLARGHDVKVLEPVDAWSRAHLVQEYGEGAIAEFHQAYPRLNSFRYQLDTLDIDLELQGADLVLVHEWNTHALIEALGRHRTLIGGYRLFFHDTHHRSVTERDSMSAYRLERYDGVLAFGEVIRQRYLAEGWADRVWTWHEAADTRRFQPLPSTGIDGDIVWIGNWGDEERSAELESFFLAPVKGLRLQARAHGVRYPAAAVARLLQAGIQYAGWLPNYRVPEVFARFRSTLHIPRRPYVDALPGIPTIRVFEALACGIPLICSPWEDAEQLFSPGQDYLVAHNESEMRDAMAYLLDDPDAAQTMAARGRGTIEARHTCAHRVDELLGIVGELNCERSSEPMTAGER
jgi:spore maturation protein CgeB